MTAKLGGPVITPHHIVLLVEKLFTPFRWRHVSVGRSVC